MALYAEYTNIGEEQETEESCAIANNTARCDDKSKQTASSHTSTYHVTLSWTWLSPTGRYGRTS